MGGRRIHEVSRAFPPPERHPEAAQPAAPEEPEAELELDEDFLRRIREV